MGGRSATVTARRRGVLDDSSKPSSSATAASSCSSPARRSAVTRMASACAAELVEGTVAMLTHAEVDLRDRVAPEAFAQVDEQAQLDAPTLHERHHFERGAAPAYSPPSGCTMSARSGNRYDSNGRAISSVTRPPPVGSP